MVELAPPTSPFSNSFPALLSNDAARVLHLAQQLEKFESAGPGEQNAVLSAQLTHLLRHAKRRSPYWRERLGAAETEGKTLDEKLGALPWLSRSELQSRFKELSIDFPQRKKMRTSILSTSGSTGTPVRIEHLPEIHNYFQFASMLLTGRWHRIDPKKSSGTLLPKSVDNDREPLGYPFRWYGPVAFGFSRCTAKREHSELYEYCAQKNPSYLFSGPNMLAGLARYALQNDRRELHPEIALSVGSTVTEETREIVEQGLGAKIVDRYSAEETGIIAIQCPKHEHLHVLSPMTVVEIVDESGAPCPVGQPGRVLVTYLQSYGMPLVRYDIGDMAEWGQPCDCGITLPVIARLWGRISHRISHPDGRTTYVKVFAREFEHLGGLEEYRFVLHRNEVIVAQLKVKVQSSELEHSVTELIQRAVGYPYRVDIRYVDEIEWGKSWKRESFAVSESPPPMQAH